MTTYTAFILNEDRSLRVEVGVYHTLICLITAKDQLIRSDAVSRHVQSQIRQMIPGVRRALDRTPEGHTVVRWLDFSKEGS